MRETCEASSIPKESYHSRTEGGRPADAPRALEEYATPRAPIASVEGDTRAPSPLRDKHCPNAPPTSRYAPTLTRRVQGWKGVERRENRSGVERGGKGWKGNNGAAVTVAVTAAATAAVNPTARLDYVGRLREMAREDRGEKLGVPEGGARARGIGN